MTAPSKTYGHITYTGTTATGGAGGILVCTVISQVTVSGDQCPGVGGPGGLGGQGGTDGFDQAKAGSDPPIPPEIKPNGANGVQGPLGALGTPGAAGTGSFPTCTVCEAKGDIIPPSVAMTAPTAALVPATAIAVSWTASDPGSGLASMALRWARMPATGGTLSAWTAPAAWAALTVKNLTAVGVPGFRTCFSVRGRDKAGNVSAWSGPRCAAVPTDDRALTASTGWTRATGAGWMSRTFTSTSRKGASQTLRGAVRVRQLGVVATTCPTCGRLTMYVGTAKVGTISLQSAGTAKRLLLLPRFTAARTGVVRLVVATRGKPVKLDALAVTAF